jgi:hypothetical protein
MTLSDLFDKKNKQFPGEADAGPYIPPALSMVTSIVGGLLTSNANLQDKIRMTWSSPFCTESEINREIVKGVYQKTKTIDNLVQQIIKELDVLVEIPKTDSKMEDNETSD